MLTCNSCPALRVVGLLTVGVLLAGLEACAAPTASDEQAAEQSLGLSSSASSPPDASPGATPSHCVGNVETGEHECYKSFREALKAATGGEIADAPEDAQAAMADEQLTARINALVGVSPATTVVIGIDYWNINYGGSTFTWTAGSGCNGNPNDADFNVSSLVPYGWNDVISSFHSYSNCWTVLYEDINWGGSTTPKRVDMSYVGDAMNDRASSILWW